MKNPFLPFIICLSIFLGCEKEEIILQEEAYQSIEVYDKAADECSFAEQTNRIHVIKHCGTEYFFHISLRLSNEGNFHRVQAIAKCYKRGGDPRNFIDFGNIEIKLSGNMHIGCGIPLEIRVPSDYNQNLVLGRVPFRSQCDDCGTSVVTLDYHKVISMIKPRDIIKATFQLKLEGCDRVEEEFFLEI